MEGFIAFAPDLYHGQIAATIGEAEILSGSLKGEQARADIAEAVAFVSQRAEVGGSGLGVVGFSLGAYFALGLSVDDRERAGAVVIFYGTRGGDYKQSKAAYLGHFAQTDDYEPASNVDGLERALRAAGRPVTFYHYVGTGHWFFEQDRSDAYDEAAAQLAWERTVVFLRDVLLS